MKTSRIFSILMLLIEKRKISASQLAERLEVSVRTIYRDIETLEGAGIPIYTTTGKNGGIHLVDGFVIDKSMFSEAEQLEIMTYLHSIQSLPAVDVELIKNKLSVVFHDNNALPMNWLDIDLSGDYQKGTKETIFNDLRETIIHKRKVIMSYLNAKGSIDTRPVEPIKIVYRYKSWYLYAYCQLRKGYRWFRISRIMSIETTQEKQQVNHQDVVISEILNVTEEPENIHIKLLFPRTVVHQVFDMYEREYIRFLDDDKVLVEMDSHIDEWLYMTLLCFGEHVEVLEPEVVKQELANRHWKAYQVYKKELV